MLRRKRKDASAKARCTDDAHVTMDEKIAELNDCLDQDNVDIWLLRKHALTTGGLINSSIRKKAWPVLMGLNASSLGDEISWQINPCRKEEMDMIQRDIHRSIMSRYNKNEIETTNQQSALAFLIKSVIMQDKERDNDYLHYYQGFHDISAVFLMNLGDPKLSSLVLRKVASLHLREAMRVDFRSLSTILECVFFPLVRVVDIDVYSFLRYAGIDVGTILPWCITLFSHDVHDKRGEDVSRLFDFFLASHPLMPMYFSVAIMVNSFHREIILGTDCDYDSMYICIMGLLSRVSSSDNNDGVTFQTLIDDAIGIMKMIPIDSLLSLAEHYDHGAHKSKVRNASNTSLLKLPACYLESPEGSISLSSGKENIDSNKILFKKSHLCAHKHHYLDYEVEIARIAYGIPPYTPKLKRNKLHVSNSVKSRSKKAKLNAELSMFSVVQTIFTKLKISKKLKSIW